MAYAFDKVMNSLGLTGQDDEDGSITTGNPAPNDTATLASSDGDYSGGAPSATNPPQAPAQQSSTNSARAKVLQKNAQKSQAPADLGKFQNQVQGARQGIQQEANAYLQAADDPYEASTDDLRGKIKAYESGNSGDTSWLSAMNSAPSLVPQLNINTDTNVKDLDLLKSDAGLQHLFRRGQDAEGTMGEAALDTALLRKNVPFQLTRDALMGDYQNLQKEKNDLILNTGEKAQDIRNKAHDAYGSRIKGLAQEELGQFDTRAKAAEADYRKRLGEAEATRHGNLSADAKSVMDQVAKDHPELAPYLSLPQNLESLYAGNVTGLPTIGANDDPNSWQDFVSAQDADQFNRVLGILGGGGEGRVAGRLAGVDPASTLSGGLDRTKLSQQLISSAQNTKKSKDQEAADALARTNSKDNADAREKASTQAFYDEIAKKAPKESPNPTPDDVARAVADPRTQTPLGPLIPGKTKKNAADEQATADYAHAAKRLKKIFG